VKSKTILVVFLVAFACAQQQSSSWKEYDFPDDGFAITVPETPKQHGDPTNPEFWVYSIPLQGTAVLSVRVSHQKRDCAATLAQLKDGAARGDSGIDPSSVKTPSIDGNPGLEYEWRSPARTSSDRFYCVNGKFYAFSASWPRGQTRPPTIVRVVNSFRLLNTRSQ
jgi:hypothetical protein